MVIFIHVSNAEYKKMAGSKKIKILYGLHDSPFGKCLIGTTANEKAICHLRFVDNDFSTRLEGLKNNWPGAEFVNDDVETAKLVKKVFSADDQNNVTVFLKGTEFQTRIWECLPDLPKGKTVGYNYVADLIGNPKAIRAVAKTVNANEIAFIIPCHRVLSKSGSSKTCWRTGKRDAMLDYERKIFDVDKKEII